MIDIKRLHLWEDIFILVDVTTDTKKRIEPVEISNDGTRAKTVIIKADIRYSYSINSIVHANDNVLVDGENIFEFIELLNAYVSSQLEYIDYKITNARGGLLAKLISEKLFDESGHQHKTISLLLQANEKIYYLKKYDCRIIVSKFNKINSRCLPYGFEG